MEALCLHDTHNLSMEASPMVLQESTQSPSEQPNGGVRRVTEEEFDAMSPEERRVAVARDVIAQVQAERIVAEQSNYIALDGDIPWLGDEEAVRNLPPCRACAVGSVFITCVRKFDRLPDGLVPRGSSHEGMRAYLTEFFSREQLALMEAAFECDGDFALGWSGDDTVEVEYDLADAAEMFGWRYADDGERLIALMENIIANNGTFSPEVAP